MTMTGPRPSPTYSGGPIDGRGAIAVEASPRPSAVAETTGRLEELIDDLDQNLIRLRSRLESVLAPEVPMKPVMNQATDSVGATCPFDHRLDQSVVHVRKAIDIANDIHDRLRI
jgi:hypothetical protein